MRVGDQVGADLQRVEQVKKVSVASSPDQYSVSDPPKTKSLISHVHTHTRHVCTNTRTPGPSAGPS